METIIESCVEQRDSPDRIEIVITRDGYTAFAADLGYAGVCIPGVNVLREQEGEADDVTEADNLLTLVLFKNFQCKIDPDDIFVNICQKTDDHGDCCG